ncbi:MAG: AAA family ATPase, partial [Candidatus Promineifilaceae bacterium]
MRAGQKTFAEEFERVLVESDTSVRRLARLTGISRRTLENWLYGRTSRPRHIEPILDVAQALHLSTQDTDRLLRATEHPTLAQLKQQGERRESESAIPLIGRTAEWREVQAALQTALQGRAHWLSIRGEAGIGKTRLAEELITWARSQGFFVARTRSYHTDGSLAYATVAELLRQYHQAGRLRKLGDTSLVEIARLIPELIEERSDLEAPGPLLENWQRTRFYKALADAILSEDGPAVLVMDDMQWLDQESLEWLHYLLRFDTSARL